MYREDTTALDYLTSRHDVDPSRVGVGGLSGGGLRTVLLSLSPEELADCFVDGRVSSTCEFCNTTYSFTPEDLAVTRQ